MSYKVKEIAEMILSKASNSDTDDLISNLKLQKLLYYVQGFHLAYFDTPLFDEEIEAWMYGPVVPVIYNKYKKYGKSGIECNSAPITFENQEEEDLFNEVYNAYNKFSAIGLMELTHSEEPWKVSSPPRKGQIINKETLKSFFKTKLN